MTYIATVIRINYPAQWNLLWQETMNFMPYPNLIPVSLSSDSNSSLIHNCQPTLIIWIADLVGVSMNKNHHHFSWARQFHLCCHFLFSKCRVREKKRRKNCVKKWNFYEYPLSLSRWIWTIGKKTTKCWIEQMSIVDDISIRRAKNNNNNNSKTAWRTKS